MQACNISTADSFRHGLRSGSATRAVRFAAAGFLTACVLSFAVHTIHWPLVNDPAQLSYFCFLMDHGRAPYRDITELNMPGILLTNWTVMHTLGPGPLAWRFFDFLLLAVMALSMIVISLPYDWLAGVFAAALFALIHGRDGPGQAGQRDLIIAVLLVAACACLFHAFRAKKVWPFFCFGLCASWASAVKPLPLPFVLLLFAAGLWRWRASGRSPWLPFASGLAGLVLPAAGIVVFLLRHRALGAFLGVVLHTLPDYAHLGRHSFLYLLVALEIPSLYWLLIFALAAILVSRHRCNWEHLVLLGGIALGLFSYFGQGKGFPYHRYPFIAFVLLWIAIELASAARRPGLARLVGCAGILFGLAVALPYLKRADRACWPANYMVRLQTDLTELGGSRLSGHIQCLAMQADCDTVLYRMRLLQSTGLAYDYFIFGDPREQPVQRVRAVFWRQFLRNPPQVIIVTEGLYPNHPWDYRKLSEWPRFSTYLGSHYILWRQTEFAPNPAGARGFRVYLRRNFLPSSQVSSPRTQPVAAAFPA